MAWSPDGKQVVYSEGVTPPFPLKIRPADGSGEGKVLHDGWKPSFSRDGRYLVFSDFDRETSWNIWSLDMTSGVTAALVSTKAGEGSPVVSADGRYMAYMSDESGPNEIYLRRFPAGEGRWQVSNGGGEWPRFNRKGDKLYYVKGNALVEVDVALGPEPNLGVPRELFVRRSLGRGLVFGWSPGFDIAPDGDRFLIVVSEDKQEKAGGIVVEENWTRAFE
jgi:Tol biopolymer transport system component